VAPSSPSLEAAFALSLALPAGIALLCRARWIRGDSPGRSGWEPKGDVWWVHWVYYYAYVVVLGPVFLCVVGLLGILLLLSQLTAK
jgi:hypothetical protein